MIAVSCHAAVCFVNYVEDSRDKLPQSYIAECLANPKYDNLGTFVCQTCTCESD